MPWTRFQDQHAGGGLKFEPYEEIYIEAPEPLARAVFSARTGLDPDESACSCCGPNYLVSDDFPPPFALTRIPRDVLVIRASQLYANAMAAAPESDEIGTLLRESITAVHPGVVPVRQPPPPPPAPRRPLGFVRKLTLDDIE